MSQNIDRKLKTALDETRLLILGVQILLGFEFQCAFQDRFDRLADGAKQLNLAALGLIVLSVAILIAPSMQHQDCGGWTIDGEIDPDDEQAGQRCIDAPDGRFGVVGLRGRATDARICSRNCGGRLPRMYVRLLLVWARNIGHRLPSGIRTDAAFPYTFEDQN